ncbi:MAG: HigA family addiction module antitoxin [Bacteriovoracales bacterium]
MKRKNLIRKRTTPGEILNEEYLKPFGITQKKLADHIGVDIKVINRLVNGKTSISPALALKLASSFNTTPQFWLNAQLAVDLDKAKRLGKKVLPLVLKAG